MLPDGRSFGRSDADEYAIGIFENLRDSADAIPPPLISGAEELRSAAPEFFKTTLMRRVQMVGLDFSPTNAAEFVEILNRTVQRDMNQL